ncbi:SDR family NAD(P)-dependent oxidoreductase [Geodermatophilus sp. SYSU D01119]
MSAPVSGRRAVVIGLPLVADAVAAELRAGGAQVEQVASAREVVADADGVRERLGGVDLVVAALGGIGGGPFGLTRAERWAEMVEQGAGDAVLAARAFLDDLLTAAANDRPADLVLVGSAAASELVPAFAVHAATAAGAAQLARTLRVELGGTLVRVRHVAVGWVATQTTADGAALTPADVARTVVFTTTMPPTTNVAEVSLLATRYG